MTDINKIILSKMLDGKSVGEIARDLNKNPIHIHRRIKQIINSGYAFTREIKDSGEICYNPEYALKIPEANTAHIKLADNHFKAMLISDLHLGNEYQNIRYLNMIYDYCAKEGIHIIINAGDVIDGTFSKSKQKIDNPEKQITYTIKNYPFDENILNLICFGNHDYSAFENFSIDINTMLNSARPDLIGLGFGISIINIENDQLFIKHPINNLNLKTINRKLIICGHKHKAAIYDKQGTLLIHVPSLSDLCFDSKQKKPGAIIMELSFNKGLMRTGYFEQLLVSGGISTICESEFDLDLNHDLLTEDDVIEKAKVKTLQSRQMSQIDKFNERYHR